MMPLEDILELIDGTKDDLERPTEPSLSGDKTEDDHYNQGIRDFAETLSKTMKGLLE